MHLDVMDMMGDWRTYQNGNTTVSINLKDGTKIRRTEDDEFHSAFAENIDLKITDRCTGTNCAVCHEGSGPNGKHGDPLGTKWIETLHPYQEIALGGGDVLEYPDLIPLLEKLRHLKVIANITVHEKHFMENFEFIKRLYKCGLVHGIGVSMWYPSEEFIEKAKEIPTLVVHTIVGITPWESYKKLFGQNLKVLLLGYKTLRRGAEYVEDRNNARSIKDNTALLSTKIPEMRKNLKLMCFDNLALEQLDVRQYLTDEEWEHFYMGDEGSHTFYIDAVTGTFAQNSTAPLDERYPVMDSVDEMFRRVNGTD